MIKLFLKCTQHSILQKNGGMERFSPAIFPVAVFVFSGITTFQELMYGQSFSDRSTEISSLGVKILSSHISAVFWTTFATSCFSFTSWKNTFLVTFMTISFIAGSSNLLVGLGLTAVSSNEGSENLTFHSRWAEWMITVPLLVFMVGDLIRLRSKLVLIGMLGQFIMVLSGYVAELSSKPTVMAPCFFVAGIVWVGTTTLAFLFFKSFVSRSKVLSLHSIHALLLLALLIWALSPITFILKVAGVVSVQHFLFFSPFLDALTKLVVIGLCYKIRCLLNTFDQKKGVEDEQKQNKLQQKFLRFLYHEIRNPINTLMLGIDNLQSDSLDPEFAYLIKTIKNSALTMSRIINDAVDLSQNQTSMELITQPTDIRSLLKTAIRDFNGQAKNRDLNIQTNISQTVPERVLVDQVKLFKVFKSLISNAIKYSSQSTIVEISLEAKVPVGDEKYQISFSVKDCGPGIPEEVASTIFQPFATVRPGDFLEDEDRGSGLSLSITKVLVDLMHGTVHFTTKKNIGTTFFVVIPCDRTNEGVDVLDNGDQWSTSFFATGDQSQQLSLAGFQVYEQRSSKRSPANKLKPAPHFKRSAEILPDQEISTTPLQRKKNLTLDAFIDRYSPSAGAVTNYDFEEKPEFNEKSRNFRNFSSLSSQRYRYRSSLTSDLQRSADVGCSVCIEESKSSTSSGNAAGEDSEEIGSSPELCTVASDQRKEDSSSASRVLDVIVNKTCRFSEHRPSQDKCLITNSFDSTLASWKSKEKHLRQINPTPLTSPKEKLKSFFSNSILSASHKKNSSGFFEQKGVECESCIGNGTDRIDTALDISITRRETCKTRKNSHRQKDQSFVLESSSVSFANDGHKNEEDYRESPNSLPCSSSIQRFDASEEKLNFRDQAQNTDSVSDIHSKPRLITRQGSLFGAANHKEKRLHQRRSPDSRHWGSSENLLGPDDNKEIFSDKVFSLYSEWDGLESGIAPKKTNSPLNRSLNITSYAKSPTSPLQHSLNNTSNANTPTGASLSGPAQILIVDDVTSNVKLTEMILKKAGYKCDIAFNGLEAVGMAMANHYQLIFMDNVMPVMNGIEATQQILAFDNSVTIVGMTGNVLQRDQDNFMKAGAKFIIQKPADKTQILKVCKEFVKTSMDQDK